jgi:hypothetical protein
MAPTSRSRYALPLALAAAATLAVATYGGMLRYGFTGSDTIPLIFTGRVASWGDLARIFTQPLMGGTSFVQHGLFYRPLSTLSFGLDQALWGLRPFGYHLTDLVLHTAVTILVLLVVRRLCGGRLGVALLAAAIFTTHPILVESVPAIGRRQDILAALCLLLAILFHLRGESRGGRRWTVAAMAAYFAALGAKEVALLFPLIVLAHAAGPVTGEGDVSWLRGLRRAHPYLALTAAYLLLRFALLGRVGGVIDEKWGPWRAVLAAVVATRKYVADLVYPVDVVQVPPQRLVQALMAPVALAAGGVLLVIVATWSRVGWRWVQDEAPVWRAALRAAVAAGMLALAGLAIFPLVPPSALDPWRRAVGWGGLALLLAASLLTVVGAGSRQRLGRWLAASEVARWQLFFLLWLPPLLAMSAFAHRVSHRSMYVPVIPFSAIVALALTDGWRAVRPARAAASAKAAPRARGAAPWLRLGAPVALAGYLLLFSPLVRSYPEWQEQGRFDEAFFRAFDRALADAPPDAVLHVHGMPQRFVAAVGRTPRARSVSFPKDYTIESWLAMRHPGNRMRVIFDDVTALRRGQGRVQVTARATGPHDVDVEVVVDEAGI